MKQVRYKNSINPLVNTQALNNQINGEIYGKENWSNR